MATDAEGIFTIANANGYNSEDFEKDENGTGATTVGKRHSPCRIKSIYLCIRLILFVFTQINNIFSMSLPLSVLLITYTSII